MVTLFYRTPRLVALILLVLISAGASAFLAIGRQEDPTITNIFATVQTLYPGAAPARVESLVTEKIETELREIAEIAKIESTSGIGISLIQIELLETLTDAEIDESWDEIRTALDEAQRELPSGTLPYDFDTDPGGTYTAIFALTPTREGVPDGVKFRYAEDLADTLRGLGGTAKVELYGIPEEEVRVTLNQSAVTSLGLTTEQIAASIGAADAKVRAGQVRAPDLQYLIEIEGEISALDRIRRIPLVSSTDGTVTRLGDIATVEKSTRTPRSEAAFMNGIPTILVAARVENGLQVDVWSEAAQNRALGFAETLPSSLELEQIFDQSRYTAERLIEVGTNMGIGIALVVAVLFVTLGVRSALIVAMVLPVVTLASVATMNFAGMEIHQMSVTGLIVALGLLVDAAIVMTDEVRQGLERGEGREGAVARAVKRLFAPLFASTLTTALSFMPMVLLPGPAGDFVGSIALAVIIMLFWSLVIALTVTPAIAGWSLRDRKGGWFAHGIPGGPLARAFRWTLSWSMRHPVNAVAYALVLPVMGFLAMPTLTAQFFPGLDRDQFYIEVEMPAGTALGRTEAVALEMDAALQGEEGIRSVSWVVGRSAPAFYYNMQGGRDQAPAYAQALITTVSNEATAELVPQLQASLSATWPEARVLVRDLVQGPPVNAPVEFRIIGPDLPTLRGLGEQLAAIMSAVPEVTIVRTDLDGGAPKVSFQVDENRARLLGLDLASVARQMEAALEGATGGSLLEGSEELPVRVQLSDTLRADTTRVAEMPIIAPNGMQTAAQGGWPGIPLSAIADVSLVPSDAPIKRYQGERVNAVQGFVQYGVLPEEALRTVQAAMDDAGFVLPAGYRFETGGDSDARNDVLNNLLASVGLIVTLTIATIALTFNSFRLTAVALVVAGLSAGLSLLSLAIFGFPFGINAVIGVIGSIGVSINAAIIILTGLQANPAAAAGDKEAAVDVVMNSSRHIVSTTITTFGGFLPLILGGGGFWPPFAMSVAGGVLLSTVISFYFTPPMFRLVYAWRFRQIARGAATADAPARMETASIGRLAAE
ncbi:MAG: efflux RND transporter permease subunit [Pseudomonadota bacterium]